MAFVIIKFYPYTMNTNLWRYNNANNCQLGHNYNLHDYALELIRPIQTSLVMYQLTNNSPEI